MSTFMCIFCSLHANRAYAPLCYAFYLDHVAGAPAGTDWTLASRATSHLTISVKIRMRFVTSAQSRTAACTIRVRRDGFRASWTSTLQTRATASLHPVVVALLTSLALQRMLIRTGYRCASPCCMPGPPGDPRVCSSVVFQGACSDFQGVPLVLGLPIMSIFLPCIVQKRSAVQVVEQINKRAGTAFQAYSVQNRNGRGKPSSGGIANHCYAEHVQDLFNETTLKNIAMQYAVDVLNFGYV
jgi:hypothetical protein